MRKAIKNKRKLFKRRERFAIRKIVEAWEQAIMEGFPETGQSKVVGFGAFLARKRNASA